MVEIVAHRGWSSHYPENSEPAIRAAIEAGCRWIECDVQFSRDAVPMVFHDATLRRTSGRRGNIFDYLAGELGTIPLRQPAKAGGAQATYIPGLAEILSLIRAHPGVTIFVEIKDESLRHFGLSHCLEILLAAVYEARDQVVLIAYDHIALARAAGHGKLRIGWILASPDAASRQQAEILRPEFLICNHRKLGNSEPWPGPWQWMLYEINDRETAERFAERGIAFIEASDIGKMMVKPSTATP